MQRIEQGSRLERLTGKEPYILGESKEWYGKRAHVFERKSDGRTFLVYPRGMFVSAQDKFLETVYEEHPELRED